MKREGSRTVIIRKMRVEKLLVASLKDLKTLCFVSRKTFEDEGSVGLFFRPIEDESAEHGSWI